MTIEELELENLHLKERLLKLEIATTSFFMVHLDQNKAIHLNRDQALYLATNVITYVKEMQAPVGTTKENNKIHRV